MELYVFRHSEWEELYHCTYDIDIIPLEKRVHEIHGVLIIALATIFMLIYIPTLSIIMFKFLDKPAYQLMFLIGVTDVLILITALIPCGIWSFEGYVFCTQPTLIYMLGCFGTGFWVLSTESSAILAFYRCLELWRPFVANSLFKGRRTLLWIGFSLFHFTAVFFFGMPVIYSSIDGAFAINPHAGYIEDTEGKALIQALIICSCEAISDAYWVIVLQGPAPPQIVIFIGMYTWICSHGVPGLIYISMNKSVRDSIFNVLKIKKRVTPSRNAVFDSSVNPAQLFNVIIV
ncbi:serpentine type 7TM GPCR chemoreceptor srt domain-containing protein [Ditylenchus destructor]|uniref:Serpentine type 7TM GPCR chemoreceptor srt domain-containing protein n=1 Tax=Ditylenchus destructor TaxID=166010 RepID=A0AAD4MK91_9BILA|nr:serpentine type 7TM GPCR chemoreceptor srt domain-containing protein [Ditylenchus destructor]